MANDYRILASPRISRSTFAIALKQGGSPAAPYANDCYGAIAGHGVDPALGLAVFQHESSMGRAGVASRTKSWGNLRDPATGTFKSYSSWRAGADDMARLLAVYGHNAIRKGKVTATARTFPFVWAPAADNNAPAAYGSAIVASINRFRSIEGKGPAYDATYSGSTSSSGSGVNATLAGSTSGMGDYLPPTITLEGFQAAIVSAGICVNPKSTGFPPGTEDCSGHRLTNEDAAKLAATLRWPKAGQLASAIVGLIYQSLGQPNSVNPDFTMQANQNIADAVAAIPDAIGKIAGGLLVNVVVIGAVLGLGWAGIRRILSSGSGQ